MHRGAIGARSLWLWGAKCGWGCEYLERLASIQYLLVERKIAQGERV